MRAHDLTVAVRNLVGRPGFAITAILLLALGAGANAAVFSVVRGILLKPLSYHDPERLVAFWPREFISNEELGYWRERTRSFEQIAGSSPGWLMSLIDQGREPLKVTGSRVSDNFFTTLGVRALVGRPIEPGDGTPGRPGVAVLSGVLFAQHFGGDPGVIGKIVEIDGRPHQIIGVMSAAFEFLEPGTDLWTPLPFDPRSPNHRFSAALGVARLRAGVSADTATRELLSLLPTMRSELAKASDWGNTVHVTPLKAAVTTAVQPSLLVLLAASGLILLLAAVNLATLVLGRSIERAREIAVRTALGASRARIARQFIVEQLVMSAAGAIAGLALARFALPLLTTRIPAEVPRQGEISLDIVVFGFVLAVTVAVAVILAFVPAAIASRPQLQPLLRQTQSTGSRGRRRTLGSLVAAQIALAVVLGIGAGLMLRTLWNLQRVDPGFDAERVLTFRLQTVPTKYPSLEKGLPYFEQVLARIRAIPGVTHVGAIQHIPLTGYNWRSNVYRVDNPPPPGTTAPSVVWRFIGWDYFQTMGIPLHAGRGFLSQDRAGSPAVAVINETFAKELFGSAESAIGQRLVSASGRGKEDVEVVGVSRDVRFRTLDTPAEPEIYRPLAQTFMFPMGFVVRTEGNPAQLAAAVRQAAYAVDPTVPVGDMHTLSALLAGTLGRPRLVGMLMSVFAACGLFLSVIGVYGSVAYWVRQQEREFSIRLALGAAPAAITASVVRQGAFYAFVGIAIGIPVAFGVTGAMRSLVYGVSPRDPLTFATLPLMAALATVLACYLPARRAAKVDPISTMRMD